MQNDFTLLNHIYPELSQYGITTFGYYTIKTHKNKLTKHDHGRCYEICFLEDGLQPYYIYPHMDVDNAVPYFLHGGEVFITHPHEIHSTGDFGQLRGRLCWIQLDSECPCFLMQRTECVEMLRQALESINHPILHVPRTVSSRLTEAFQLILTSDKERLFRACELLSLFIMELADWNRNITDAASLRTSMSSEILEAVTFIRNNLFYGDLNLQSVAKHLHYSPSYTMSVFKKEMGLTIHEFIQRSKIEYACKLLLSHSVTETALYLSYSSSQHFSKVFKEHTGMTPSEFIRINRKES